MKKKQAFTLLEILVVIGLIMVIVGMVTASYSTAQKKSRDAKRSNDIKTIQSAMEQYYSVCGYKYPPTIPVGAVFCPSPSTLILPTIPASDPLGTPYPSPNWSTSGYQVCALNEIGPTICVSNLQ